ncbi:MAG: acetate--CoA ligase family protein [Polaromonas sp.]|nr:acetate--CoA ligase family protein [Polaromonas sp.]
MSKSESESQAKTALALDRLLRPRSVAVIGASADPSKTAGRPVAYLQKHGFSGAIYPINPRVDTLAGLTCYPSVSALPQVPDVGLVLVGPERAEAVVRELAACGTAAAIVLAGGYTETGEAGARRQQALKDAAGNMRLLGPNTIGLVNLTDGITLSASGALEIKDLPAGNIAVISQSGGILGALLSRAAARGIGFSKLVSTSNEADLEVADILDYLVDDDATQVIALYIETLRNPVKFRRAAERARLAGKSVVAFKVGRSEQGAAAAVSHTGALAGADRVYDALFAQAGVVRAQTFADLLDMSAALASGRRLLGRRVAILTSTGGAGTLVADSLGLAGFETPAPDADTASRLRALQQKDQAALDRNPIDVTLAGLQPLLLRGAISILLASPTYDAVVVIVGSSALAMPDLMADAIHASLPGSAKPLLAYVSPHAPEVARLLGLRGVPAFSAPESCTAAFTALLMQEEASAHGVQKATPHLTANDQGSPLALYAAGLPAGSLDEHEAKQLFVQAGLGVVRESVVRTAAEAQRAAEALGGPVVLKLLSPHILHKSEVGGVAVNVAAADVAARLALMKDAVQDAVKDTTAKLPDAWLVQEMVSGGNEMLLGLQRDPLGMVLLLGMGGVTAELLDDSVLRLLPEVGGLQPAEARAMLHALKTWPLLNGYRGRPLADVDALVDAIVRFSQLADALGERLLTAEINPLFVLPAGQGVRAADGVVVLT